MKSQEIIDTLKKKGMLLSDDIKIKYNNFSIDLYFGIQLSFSAGIFQVSRKVGEIKKRTFMTLGQCISIIEDWAAEARKNI